MYKLKYYKNLDGVRALAALMVVVFHFFRDITPNSKSLHIAKEISYFGQTGVTLFFVLSGFLITRILLNAKETQGYFRNFYLRRTLRILPLYYLFLILWYFIAPLLIVMHSTSFNQQVYYYTFLQNFARTFDWNSAGPHHFWSLAVEEHFYLLWPLIVFFFSKKNVVRVILLIIIFAMILRGFMLNGEYSVFIFTLTRFDSLAIGALMAFLELENIFCPKNSKNFLMMILGFLISLFLVYAFIDEGLNDLKQNLRYLLFSLVYFAAIGYLLSVKDGHLVNKFLRTSFLNYTGKISYGLYVYHPLVFLLCANFLDSGIMLLDFIIGLIASYLIAGLSYRYFESKFLILKKYFEYDENNKSRLK